jgi:hypothetical protein
MHNKYSIKSNKKDSSFMTNFNKFICFFTMYNMKLSKFAVQKKSGLGNI